MSKQPTQVRLLMDKEWSHYVTAAAMQIQAMARPVRAAAEKTTQFANTEQGRDMLEGLRRIMKAKEDAETISNAIHEADDIADVQAILESLEINAITLMSLIILERGKEASDVEKQSEKKVEVAHRERAANGGKARVMNDKDGKQALKLQAYLQYRQFDYKGATEFAVAIEDKFPLTYSFPVLGRWFRQWGKGMNLPKNLNSSS